MGVIMQWYRSIQSRVLAREREGDIRHDCGGRAFDLGVIEGERKSGKGNSRGMQYTRRVLVMN